MTRYIDMLCNGDHCGTMEDHFQHGVRYSRARLIRMTNARKNHSNYPRMQIIRAYFTLCFNQQLRVVSWTTIRIILEVRISEGQIIRAILYILPTHAS